MWKTKNLRCGQPHGSHDGSVAVVLQQIYEPLRCLDQQLVTGLPVLGVHYFQTVRWIVVYGFDHLLQPNLNLLQRHVFVHANILRNVDGLGQHRSPSQFRAFGGGLRLGSRRFLDNRRQQREVSSTGAHFVAQILQARTASQPTLLVGLGNAQHVSFECDALGAEGIGYSARKDKRENEGCITPHAIAPTWYKPMPARQQAVSVGIMPTLNRKIAIAAARESTSAQRSTLARFGASKDSGKARTGTV